LEGFDQPLILSDLNLASSHRWERRKIPRNTRRTKRHGTVTFAAEMISDGILFPNSVTAVMTTNDHGDHKIDDRQRKMEPGRRSDSEKSELIRWAP